MIIKKSNRNKQGYSKLAISLDSTSSSLGPQNDLNRSRGQKSKKVPVETCEKATETTPSIQLDFDQLEEMYGDDLYGGAFEATEAADLDDFDDNFSAYSEEGEWEYG